MCSNDIKITICGIGKLSKLPFTSTNEIVHEFEPTSAIDGSSKEIIEISSEYESAVSSPTDERPSKEIDSGANQMRMRHDELQRFITEEDRGSIPKVPHRLREAKPKDYEPNAISIGPYHYSKDHLRVMDDVKQTSFRNIVKETKLEFNAFVEFMKPLKERALSCYEKSIHADFEPGDKFIKMMVYDGCFIVQLIRHMYLPDLAMLPRHIHSDMWEDLLLVENQLPFFVLFELDKIIMKNDKGDHVPFEKAALSFFFELDVYTPNIFSETLWESTAPSDIKHLLDMVHKCCRPSPQGIEKRVQYLDSETEKHKKCSKPKETKGSIRSWKFIRSASDLDNAGIDFVGVEENSLYDVTFTKYTRVLKLKFCKKVLKIPTLYVRKSTESGLRNLMAYEQQFLIGQPTYVSDYVMLMDNLIDTGEDVQLLCSSGVIENRLADVEAVACMFNKLGDYACSKEDFYYAEIFDKVNRYCKESTYHAKWYKHVTKLRKGYFSSPWTVCSLVAAVILLVATALQTIYTLITYYNS